MTLLFLCAFEVSICYATIMLASQVFEREVKKKQYEGMYKEKINLVHLGVLTAIIYVYTIVVGYILCIPQNFVEVFKSTWLMLAIYAFVLFKFDERCEGISSTVLAIISAILFIVSAFGPVQQLVYVNDISDGDITYAIVSDEILANIELDISNSRWDKDKYDADSPEIRFIDGETLAVYHIRDKYAETGSNLEYIPGYIIQRKGKLPEVISRRIYFDPSNVMSRDALRTVRRQYPTEIISGYKFDIDDNWKPYIVYQYRENRFSNTNDEYGLLILDMSDGICKKYPASEGMPEWVDFKTTYIE